MDVDLTGADLTGARLGPAVLARTSLRRANLRGADLRAYEGGADMTGAIYDSSTRWPSHFDPHQHGATQASSR